MWIVYGLYNAEEKKIYIGQTTNIEKRLVEHNQKRGNHFTAKTKGQWRIIYTERCLSQSEALKREKQLKSYRGREFVKKFIKD